MTPAEQDDYFRRHLKHRMTALLSPLVIGDGNSPTAVYWRGQQDVYKAALDGSMVTLRLFIEFTGVQSDRGGTRLQPISNRRGRLTLVDFSLPAHPVADLQRGDYPAPGPIASSLSSGDRFSEEEFIAHVHKWISVRAAHLKQMGHDEGRPTFVEHYEAARIILTKIHDRLYCPRGLALNVEPDLLHRLAIRGGTREWEGLPLDSW